MRDTGNSDVGWLNNTEKEHSVVSLMSHRKDSSAADITQARSMCFCVFPLTSWLRHDWQEAFSRRTIRILAFGLADEHSTDA
jgi:hypothetical protein